MAERLTEHKTTKGVTRIVIKPYTIMSEEAQPIADKLCAFEDILEKYGIENVEELDDLIANYRTSPILTEEMIKEIAVNEQRKVIQSMVKEITEKECNQLYTELNTWKMACELACDVILRFTDGCPCKADYFYQQAKKENNK